MIDLDAGTEKMNCLGCGGLVERLERNDELCSGCMKKWSIEFCREWCSSRFGKRVETETIS